jgi:hypothetical protein
VSDLNRSAKKMAYSPQFPNWTPVTNSGAQQLTCSTVTPGVVHSIALTALPYQLQKLPGLSEAYISGYCSTYKDKNEVEVRGEIVAARYDGIGKAYVWFLGVDSASSVCVAGPLKPPEGHYYPTGDGVPIEKLFGKSPLPERKEPNKPAQHNAGSRPSSGDSPASETTSAPAPRG